MELRRDEWFGKRQRSVLSMAIQQVRTLIDRVQNPDSGQHGLAFSIAIRETSETRKIEVSLEHCFAVWGLSIDMGGMAVGLEII